MSPREAFGGKPLSVGVQAVLYNNDFDAVRRAVAGLVKAAQVAIEAGVCTRAELLYGDSSPAPCFTPDQISALEMLAGKSLSFTYKFFGKNMGSAQGQNELSFLNTSDMVLISNPDVVASPRALVEMLKEFRAPGVGVVEAKQLPIEHPKDYDPVTGETLWCTGAYSMFPAALFKAHHGFDSENFFLYCDDVDLSWRVRQAGFRLVFQPAATVFHDKRLSNTAGWQPSSAERYYSAEAALLLSYKWSRFALNEEILAFFKSSGTDDFVRAAAEFERRKHAGLLPAPTDEKHEIGYFADGTYAKHRYAI